MKKQLDLRWLEDLLEGRYGLAQTDEMRSRLSAIVQNQPRAQAEALERRPAWIRDVVEDLVVGETYFFREAAQIEYCVKELFTARCKQEQEGKSASTRPLRILSAGCSSGEEAYSLAIAMDAQGGSLSRQVSILGVDISKAAIQKAQRGRYSAWSLRATPESIQEKYFRRRGDAYELDERIRASVTFEERNLFETDSTFWMPGVFDVIFFRNVMIYFSARSSREIATRFASALSPQGCLFLGHSETLRGISDDFDLVHVGDVFFHRKKGKSKGYALQSPWVLSSEPTRVSRTPLPSAPSPNESRVPLASMIDAMDRHRIASLIESERFDEALSALEALPRDAQTILFGAVIDTTLGRFEDAEKACFALLLSRRCEAEAHCLLGLCREHQRAYDSAERHYIDASRIDARFAMPRLHRGLLLDRSGDTSRARLELEQAASLLETEEGERISLFGGGFSRKTLIGVCRERLRPRAD